MKIIHIITGLGDGGAESVLYRLCTYGTDHQHHVVSLTGMGKYGDLLQDNGVQVTCLGLKPRRANLIQIWRLVRLIKNGNPDVVQTWMYHADLLGGICAYLAGANNVVWGIRNTSLSRENASVKTGLVANVCAAFSYFLPKLIICAAEESRRVHVSYRYCERRMRVVHNGYDFSLFAPNPSARRRIRALLSVGENENLIGFVARYDVVKGHIDLLDALSLLRDQGVDFKCVLIGTGLDEKNRHLLDAILERDLLDHILLLGPRTDIPDIMNALDIHVMSSRSEGFPNVLAEAMSCGTPCVSTDVGDARLIIESFGILVPVGRPRAMADAIAYLASEKSTPSWLLRQENGRSHIKDKFGMRAMIDGFEAVWNEGADR